MSKYSLRVQKTIEATDAGEGYTHPYVLLFQTPQLYMRKIGYRVGDERKHQWQSRFRKSGGTPYWKIKKTHPGNSTLSRG